MLAASHVKLELYISLQFKGCFFLAAGKSVTWRPRQTAVWFSRPCCRCWWARPWKCVPMASPWSTWLAKPFRIVLIACLKIETLLIDNSISTSRVRPVSVADSSVVVNTFVTCWTLEVCSYGFPVVSRIRWALDCAHNMSRSWAMVDWLLKFQPAESHNFVAPTYGRWKSHVQIPKTHTHVPTPKKKPLNFVYNKYVNVISNGF